MAINLANAYGGVKANTASPAELTLMLYDGAIKFCNIAASAIEKKDIIKANNNLIKAQRVIMELRGTLNFNYPVAADFERVYDYIYRQLISANIKKDPEILEDALGYIREMRETWKEVMKIGRGAM